MPELHFKGKEFVFNHHLSVPYRPLIPDAKKSVGKPDLSGNLIVQGDNLHALKALLPMYAGKVDCIFIDPPYNTGSENWSYNDNVNSPMLKEWLSSNPINKEDMLRHDKWLAMMYPRLKLLYELLSDFGSIWVTLDDNEVHHARAMLDEIFGDTHCVGQLAWQKRTSRENRASLSPSIDHLLLYSKCSRESWKLVRNLLDAESDAEDSDAAADADEDNEPNSKGTIPFSAQGTRKNQVYKIVTPTGVKLDPPKGRCWGATEPEFLKLKALGRIYWPKKGNGRPRVIPDGEKSGLVPNTLWMAREVGDTEGSKKLLMEIFSERESLGIHAPKPHELLERIIHISTNPKSIVLDSFAGSGSTAHAVLNANKKDGGNRKFVLVECEDYADTLTAERMRRVIHGYSFKGKQREELYRENITFTQLKKADKLLAHVQSIENLEKHRFDEITKSVENGFLSVYGEKIVKQKTEGIGGTFTYCSLGDAVDMDGILTGKSLPSYEAIGSWLFHTATGEALDAAKIKSKESFLGESSGYFVWLVYEPKLAFLKSREAALTLDLAEKIAKKKTGKKHLVFAPAKFAPNKTLLPLGVEYAPLPFSLFRIEKA